MSWPEYWAASQVLAEERIGTLIRSEAAREDAAFNAAMKPDD